VLEDRLRDALETAPDADDMAPRGWPDIEHRVRVRRRRRRQGTALVGAAVLAGVSVAALLITRGAGPERATSAGRPSQGPVAVVTTVPPAAAPPAIAAAVRADGSLVVLDARTGEELRTLASAGQGRLDRRAGSFIEHVSVGPDGQTIYYTTCCEPTVGSIFSVSTAGGTPVRVADGSAMSFAPTGTRAVLDRVVGVYLQRGEGQPELIDGTGTRPGDDEQAVDIGWDGSGQRLVVGRDHGDEGQRIDLVQLSEDGAPTSTPLSPPAGVGWSEPRFGPNGAIYAIESVSGTPRAVRILDTQGNDRGTLDLGGRVPVALGSDQTASWLIVALQGGGIATIDPAGRPDSVPAGEYTTIDW
jgi:hypothetical protein